MKALTIAWKDTLIRFRDRNALILMVAAPLVLSLIIGSAFGGFISGSDPTPFDAIPVLVINEDEGTWGAELVSILGSDDLAELIALEETADLTQARQRVQSGEARTAVYIPPNFSATVNGETDATQALVQFYADPGATLTPNIVRGVVVQILNGFNAGIVAGELLPQQISQIGRAPTQGELEALPVRFDEAIGELTGGGTAVTLNNISVGETEATPDISPFAFFAPSMGLLFLMFSLMDATRSILEEEKEGTLDRLVSTPTNYIQIVLGKIGGVFLTGTLQFGVFVVASSLLFQLNWGRSLLGLVMVVLSTVLALTSLGALIAAFAKDLNQAGVMGTVVTLVFAALGGNFVPAQNFPPFLEQLSKITVTRWSLDGFTDLTIQGLGAGAVLLETAVLAGFGLLLFVLAVMQFQRRVRR